VSGKKSRSVAREGGPDRGNRSASNAFCGAGGTRRSRGGGGLSLSLSLSLLSFAACLSLRAAMKKKKREPSSHAPCDDPTAANKLARAPHTHPPALCCPPPPSTHTHTPSLPFPTASFFFFSSSSPFLAGRRAGLFPLPPNKAPDPSRPADSCSPGPGGVAGVCVAARRLGGFNKCRKGRKVSVRNAYFALRLVCVEYGSFRSHPRARSCVCACVVGVLCDVEHVSASTDASRTDPVRRVVSLITFHRDIAGTCSGVASLDRWR